MPTSRLSTLYTLAIFKVLRPSTPAATERLGRQYTLIIQSDSTYQLTTLREGPKRSGLYTDLYPDYPNLLLAVQKNIQTRIQHGYTFVYWWDNFPLISWIQERGYPIEQQSDIEGGSIQMLLPFD